MSQLLVFAFLWYGIYQTIQDLLIWSFWQWNLRAAMLDMVVATVSYFAAALLLRDLLRKLEEE